MGQEWEVVLQMMLDLGVDINDAQGTKHATALEAVVKKSVDSDRDQDQEKLVSRTRFLLEKGANANTHVGPFGSVLHYLCSHPFIEDTYVQCYVSRNPVLEFFLNWPGIDVNAEGGIYGTALQASAAAGDCLSVEQLLRRGADVNLRCGKYGSALNAAIIKGYWHIVEVLLDAGALPDCRH
ncbi:hypothetical protein VTH06DRAFT_5013 [Thermothelomyces fergusii]